MKLKSKINSINILDIIFLAIIIVLCLIFSYINLFQYKSGINSDVAAESLLAREIWETKQWIPSTWYASTETRVISTATWSALIYGLTQNLSLSMGLGCIVGMIFLLACGAYLAKELGLDKTTTLLFLVLCLLLVNSMGELQMLYLHAGYYVCHLGVLLWSLGCYVRLLGGQRGKIGFGILNYLFHFLLACQGSRAILMISGPLFGMEIVRRMYDFYKTRKIDKKDNYITISVFATLIIGYLGSKLPFSVGQPLFIKIRNAPTKFVEQIIPHFLDTIWWEYLSGIEKIVLLASLVFVISYVTIIVIKGIQKREIETLEWVFLTCVLSLVLTALALTFTNVESANRYYILVFFCIAFALILMWKKNHFYKGIVMTIVVITFVGNCIRVYVPMMRNEIYPESSTIQVAEYLEAQGYEYGYTTFEHANYMTVAVDGRVQVSAVNSMETMEICKWLTSETWYVPNVPYESKTAYIVTEGNLDSFQKFYKQHENEIVFDTQIGIYHIFGSDYNYSTLGY